MKHIFQGKIFKLFPRNVYLLSVLNIKKLVAAGRGFTFGLELNWESFRSFRSRADGVGSGCARTGPGRDLVED